MADYGAYGRRLGKLKNLVDTVMDVRNEEEDIPHLRAELDRFLEEEESLVGWPTTLKDLANSIIELVMDEID
jgi:hypothetical protein